MAALTPVQKRSLWVGGLAALLGTTIGVVAYASGKSSGAAACGTKAHSMTIQGAGQFSNNYPPGSSITIALPQGASWSPAGITAWPPSATNFSLQSAPTSGNAPAQVTYHGGGNGLELLWVDASGNPQATYLVFNG
jgi:hypothetical protein